MARSINVEGNQNLFQQHNEKYDIVILTNGDNG